ncbi:MAG: hypothetical protein PHT69_11375 [Bacteroidales bacterium]|nr:hypothetical protein [Bacteroidales bacterium]
MKTNYFIFLLIIIICSISIHVKSQDSLSYKGQLSSWVQYNPDISKPWLFGGRYMPQANYEFRFGKGKMLDFEASANIFGNAFFDFPDSSNYLAKIKLYRAWGRFSTEQFELRAGLQKINFGSANMIRPLMWFDKIDPRDPLQLTDGVWGILGRYYFLNNANLWIWGLYGNKDLKTWENASTNQKFPELGGRLQLPVPKGETALSYHYRLSDLEAIDTSFLGMSEIAENRVGLDGKWDLSVGLWVETVWINKLKNIGMHTNQEILNAGLDYTFPWGNGIYTVVEQLLVSFDENPFEFSNKIYFTGTSVSYPLSMFDNIGVIIYYDWMHKNTYSFANWKKQYDNFSFYLMAYFNPMNYQMPIGNDAGNIFAGKGIQLMIVYNH